MRSSGQPCNGRPGRAATATTSGGIPDEVGADPARYADDFAEQQGGLWGVYRFKQGFGGQVVRYTGAWDLPLSPVGQRIYHLARRLRGGTVTVIGNR